MGDEDIERPTDPTAIYTGAEVTPLLEENDRLTNAFRAAEVRIAELEKRLLGYSSLKTDFDELRKAADQSDREWAECKRTLGRLKRRLSELEAQHTEDETRLHIYQLFLEGSVSATELSQALVGRDRRIRELEQALAEAQAVPAQTQGADADEPDISMSEGETGEDSRTGTAPSAPVEASTQGSIAPQSPSPRAQRLMQIAQELRTTAEAVFVASCLAVFTVPGERSPRRTLQQLIPAAESVGLLKEFGLTVDRFCSGGTYRLDLVVQNVMSIPGRSQGGQAYLVIKQPPWTLFSDEEKDAFKAAFVPR